MLVVIDESGCAGFKPNSSTHYVLGMVIFMTFKDAEDTARIIRKTNPKREFHFAHCNNKWRDTFFEAIKPAKFDLRMFVVEKRTVYSQALREDDILFTSYFLKQFISSNFNELKDATVKIDGQGSRIFKKGFNTYIRQQVPEAKLKNVKFSDSKNDLLIQLADMTVGAFARPYNNPDASNAYKWRNMIEPKILNVWKFK